jgi:hypothetical protein
MLTSILDSFIFKLRRAPALSKRELGWAGTRNPFALLGVEGGYRQVSELSHLRGRGYLLDMSNNQQIRY